MDKINEFKAAVTAAGAALTLLWGWVGWLLCAWMIMMVIDYITGSASALRNGEWSSSVAREGLWHKTGSMCAVAAAGILDFVLQILVQNTGIGFEYRTALMPICVAWYLLTEAGSVLENVGKMGAPLPSWLVKAIAVLKDKVDDSQGSDDDA